MWYSASIDYRNRTASSVQLRVTCTSTIGRGGFTNYGQKFRASARSISTGEVQIVPSSKWYVEGQPQRSETGISPWITVPLDTTAATSVDLSFYYYQTNSNNTDMTKYYDEEGVDAVWTIYLPAY